MTVVLDRAEINKHKSGDEFGLYVEHSGSKAAQDSQSLGIQVGSYIICDKTYLMDTKYVEIMELLDSNGEVIYRYGDVNAEVIPYGAIVDNPNNTFLFRFKKN